MKMRRVKGDEDGKGEAIVHKFGVRGGRCGVRKTVANVVFDNGNGHNKAID